MEHMIYAITCNGEERETLFNNYMSKDCTLSFHMAAWSFKGFNSRWVPYEVRNKFHDRFWDNILEVFTDRNREMGKAMWHNLIPLYLDNDELIQKYEELMKKIEQMDDFWKKNVASDFDQAKRLNKVIRFASS